MDEGRESRREKGYRLVLTRSQRHPCGDLIGVCPRSGRCCRWVPSCLPPSSQLHSHQSYQFFKTRVVMSAAMTMMRDTVMVTIWWTARPAGVGGQVSRAGTHKQMVPQLVARGDGA